MQTLLSQDSFNLDLLISLKDKQIGIACSCAPQTSKNQKYICLIATADQAPVRDVKEWVPTYQTVLKGDAKCSSKCTYIKAIPEPSELYKTTEHCSIEEPDGHFI